MKLRRNQKCPTHNSYFCCGRVPARRRESRKPRARYAEPKSGKWNPVPGRPGEWRIDDPHHPRGYRVRLSKLRMDQLLLQKVREQKNLCYICTEEFDDAREISPDHKDPSGMGGARRDDHPDNIAAVHRRCNSWKGSRRL